MKTYKYRAENYEREDDVGDFPFCTYLIKKGSTFCVRDAENRTCMCIFAKLCCGWVLSYAPP